MSTRLIHCPRLVLCRNTGKNCKLFTIKNMLYNLNYKYIHIGPFIPYRPIFLKSNNVVPIPLLESRVISRNLKLGRCRQMLWRGGWGCVNMRKTHIYIEKQ